MIEHRYDLGKIDYNGSGRRNCKAAITWQLEEGRFSMSAEILNPRETDAYVCGQCVDTVAAYFPRDAKTQRMLAIWERWHLNDMRAGTPAQEAYLNQYGRGGSYDANLTALTDAGYNPDNGYVYGSKWLREDLPADVVAEIESWTS